MASIIPTLEYDIFISYRQKDNKGEQWVTEFVDALNTELESAFKENIIEAIKLHVEVMKESGYEIPEANSESEMLVMA